MTAVLFERWSTKRTIAIFSVIAAVTMLAFAGVAASGHLEQLLLIGLGAIITFFGVTIVMGAFPPYLTEIYPTELRGTGSGSAVSFGRIGAVVGIFAGGGLLATDAPATLLPIVFGLPILAGGILVFLRGLETRRKLLEEISPGS